MNKQQNKQKLWTTHIYIYINISCKWHKPCRTFHPWCLCIKTRCLYHIISNHIIYIISYHVMSCHVLSCHMVSYHTSYHISYHIISFVQISFHLVLIRPYTIWNTLQHIEDNTVYTMPRPTVWDCITLVDSDTVGHITVDYNTIYLNTCTRMQPTLQIGLDTKIHHHPNIFFEYRSKLTYVLRWFPSQRARNEATLFSLCC